MKLFYDWKCSPASLQVELTASVSALLQEWNQQGKSSEDVSYLVFPIYSALPRENWSWVTNNTKLVSMQFCHLPHSQVLSYWNWIDTPGLVLVLVPGPVIFATQSCTCVVRAGTSLSVRLIHQHCPALCWEFFAHPHYSRKSKIKCDCIYQTCYPNQSDFRTAQCLLPTIQTESASLQRECTVAWYFLQAGSVYGKSLSGLLW